MPGCVTAIRSFIIASSCSSNTNTDAVRSHWNPALSFMLRSADPSTWTAGKLTAVWCSCHRKQTIARYLLGGQMIISLANSHCWINLLLHKCGTINWVIGTRLLDCILLEHRGACYCMYSRHYYLIVAFTFHVRHQTHCSFHTEKAYKKSVITQDKKHAILQPISAYPLVLSSPGSCSRVYGPSWYLSAGCYMATRMFCCQRLTPTLKHERKGKRQLTPLTVIEWLTIVIDTNSR